MLFNSRQFLVFFPVVAGLYFVLPQRVRWLLLLVASCVFYMAFIPRYILILAVVILVDYVAGIKIESSRGEQRKMFLRISILSNLATLGMFKYFNFFSESVAKVLASFSIGVDPVLLNVVLPVGLSFHTFQSLSYTIEVYFGRYKAERHLGRFALYVLYFPQLVAGPIERPQNLLPQMRLGHAFDHDRAVSGLRLALLGFLKKVLIADNLARVVTFAYGNAESMSGASLALATGFFAMQIYCDFSGYTDIARGVSRLLGIELMKNFDSPYFSASLREFWTRWHISLSTWFRDYVYVPLGGSRVSAARHRFNLLVVFMISGLWHGANWTFVAWGCFHGMLLILESSLRKLERARNLVRRVPRFLRQLLVFALVCVGWVFFRATSIDEAFEILSRVAMAWSAKGHSLGESGVSVGWGLTLMALGFAFDAAERLFFLRLRRPSAWPVRWVGYAAAVMAILLFGALEGREFVYFQF